MSLFVTELDVKSRAPTAAKWNKLFETQEDLNTRTNRSFIVLKKSATDALTFPITGVGDSTGFNTIVEDPMGVWNSGSGKIEFPNWAVVLKLTFNIDFTANHTVPMIMRAGSSRSVGQEVGDPSQGFKSFNVEHGWQSMIAGSELTPSVSFDAPSGSASQTVDNSNGTWFMAEFKG